jgi:hypothetical protein
VARQSPEFSRVHQAKPPFESCCEIHDRAYHNGGGAADAEESYERRLAADRALQICIRDFSAGRAAELAEAYGIAPEQAGRLYEVMAAGMFAAVRLGGLPCTGLSWRWGFGATGCGAGN